MLQGTIIRGTTPKHDFDLPYPVELIKDLRISYGQNNKSICTKTKNQCTFEKNSLSVQLTQEETFLFKPKKNVYIEIRIKLFDGQIVQTEDPIILRVLDTLNEEVMD